MGGGGPGDTGGGAGPGGGAPGGEMELEDLGGRAAPPTGISCLAVTPSGIGSDSGGPAGVGEAEGAGAWGEEGEGWVAAAHLPPPNAAAAPALAVHACHGP